MESVRSAANSGLPLLGGTKLQFAERLLRTVSRIASQGSKVRINFPRSLHRNYALAHRLARCERHDAYPGVVARGQYVFIVIYSFPSSLLETPEVYTSCSGACVVEVQA